jgi:HEAT repeat protein
VAASAHNHARALATQFQDSDAAIRLGALRALGMKGKAAHPYVSHMAMLLEDIDAEVRLAAVVALGRQGEAAHLHANELSQRLDDPSEEVRQAVALALGRMGKAGADVLAVQLKHGDARVRLSAAEALGQMGEVAERHTFNLAARLADSDPFSRMAAAEALGRMRELAHPYCSALAGRLQDSDPYVRMTAAESLSHLGEEGANALVSHLTSADPMVRRSIVRSLGKMAEAAHPHVRDLVSKLDDGDIRVQLTAYEALLCMEEAAAPAGSGVVWSQRADAPDGSNVSKARCKLLASSGLGRLAASPVWAGSPRARRAGANLIGQPSKKDATIQLPSARHIHTSLFQKDRTAKTAESVLELLGLNDVKITSEAARLAKQSP